MGRPLTRKALLARKGGGKEAKLSYKGNLLTENCNDLIVNTEVFPANGTAERDAALVMLEQMPSTGRVTVGAGKGYDTKDYVAVRHLKVTSHVARNVKRNGGSAIDGRTTRSEGDVVNQRKPKGIEECFGWLKTIRADEKGEASQHREGGWVFTSHRRRTTWSECEVYWRDRLKPNESKGEVCQRATQTDKTGRSSKQLAAY